MRTITHTTPGAVELTLNLGPGWVRVIVEDRDTAEITLTPQFDGDDVAAGLITRSTVRHGERDLTLTVPRPTASGITGRTVVQSSRGGVRVSQTNNVIRGNVTGLVITGDGDVYVSGARITGSTTILDAGQVRADVRLPIGSPLIVHTDDADLHITGHLHSVVLTSTSGSLTADSIGALAASTSSGDVRAASVTTANVKTMSGRVALDYTAAARVQTMSGSVDLVATTGTQAEISTMSGDVRVTAYHDGHVGASTMSGDIVVDAVRGAQVTTSTRSMSGYVSVPRTR
ncbi:DUF4097 family beta strand repeat-containing protein [Kutzneria sp. NPDC051319]|uniref:DUF4097 family beta strand repeat-containing protein n=1 Tax=Kutzneria sp. NPDC051319 TaxID=3155047 RepID=UPI003418D1D8